MSTPDPFWLAIQTGDSHTVQRLIQTDHTLLGKRAESGHTPLRMACDCGQHALAKTLVEMGAEMDAFDACAFGDTSQVLSMLDSAPELILEHSHDGWTLLHLACFVGNQDLVQALLKRDASVAAISRNPTGNTPLHAALAGGAGEEIVGCLLDHGADVNSVAGMASLG